MAILGAERPGGAQRRTTAHANQSEATRAHVRDDNPAEYVPRPEGDGAVLVHVTNKRGWVISNAALGRVLKGSGL
jgi:hypothetical protein